MALVAFQRAFYELIADPLLCIRAKEHPEVLLEKYDLTEKEYRRLQSIIWQKGMATNCTLYRINRVTPLYTLMPYTCKLLGDDLLPVLGLFWNQNRQTNLQFRDEVGLFCDFLRQRIRNEGTENQYLAEILHFETALNELRYRQEETDTPDDAPTLGKYMLNPHLRVVPFMHEPEPLFRRLLAEEGMAEDVPAPGNYYLLLGLEGEEISMKTISYELGYILTHLDDYLDLPDELLLAGLISPQK